MDKRRFHIDETHLDIWRRGALGPVRLQPLTREAAIALRHKLYRLRERLTQSEHPDAKVAQSASIKMFMVPSETGAHHWELLVHPSDTDFVQAFINAGLSRDDDPPPLD